MKTLHDACDSVSTTINYSPHKFDPTHLMIPGHFAAAAFLFVTLTSCSSPAPAPLVVEEHQLKVPASLTGNWACGTNHTDKDSSLTGDVQRLIGVDGQLQFAGQMNFAVNDNEFSVSIYGEREIQMIDEKYWERLDTLITLPTTGKLNELTAACLKSTQNQKYPTYETGSYAIEGENLMSISERRGIETICTTWDGWEKLCEEQNNPACGIRMDKALLTRTKQDFLEKQKILKSALNN